MKSTAQPTPSCSNENFCFHLGDYSFGFNGKELDKEGMGGGASTYDYGFRIYNSALAKFLSVDPLSASYASLSCYQYASLKPITCVDYDGLEGADIRSLPSSPSKASCHAGSELKVIKMLDVKNKSDLNKIRIIHKSFSFKEPIGKTHSFILKVITPDHIDAYQITSVSYTITTQEQHIENIEFVGDVLVTTNVTTTITVDLGGRYTPPTMEDLVLESSLGSLESIIKQVTETTIIEKTFEKVVKSDEKIVTVDLSQGASTAKSSTISTQRGTDGFSEKCDSLPNELKEKVGEATEINNQNDPVNQLGPAVKKAANEGKDIIKPPQ